STAVEGRTSRSLSAEAAAEMIRRRPDQRDAIIARLHGTMGAAFVRQVLVLLEAPPSESSEHPDTGAPVSMSSLAESDRDTDAAPISVAVPAASNGVGDATPIPASTSSAGSAQDEVAGERTTPSLQLPAVVRVTATDGLRVRRTPDASSRDNVLGALAPHEEI